MRFSFTTPLPRAREHPVGRNPRAGGWRARAAHEDRPRRTPSYGVLRAGGLGLLVAVLAPLLGMFLGVPTLILVVALLGSLWAGSVATRGPARLGERLLLATFYAIGATLPAVLILSSISSPHSYIRPPPYIYLYLLGGCVALAIAFLLGGMCRSCPPHR